MTSSPIQPKLLDQVRARIRVKHYSIRTEQAYVDWIKRFIVHSDKRHPRDLGAAEVEAFLTYLAVKGQVAASTRNQAKSPVGWGKERTPTSTTLTPTNTTRISLTRPIRRNDTVPNIWMCARARPIGGATDVSVFHWVVMNVIDVADQIIVIAYQMLPIPALPIATLAFGLSTF